MNIPGYVRFPKFLWNLIIYLHYIFIQVAHRAFYAVEKNIFSSVLKVSKKIKLKTTINVKYTNWNCN